MAPWAAWQPSQAHSIRRSEVLFPGSPPLFPAIKRWVITVVFLRAGVVVGSLKPDGFYLKGSGHPNRASSCSVHNSTPRCRVSHSVSLKLSLLLQGRAYRGLLQSLAKKNQVSFAQQSPWSMNDSLWWCSGMTWESLKMMCIWKILIGASVWIF